MFLSSGIANTNYDDVTLEADGLVAIPQRPEVASAPAEGIELLEGDSTSSQEGDPVLRARLAVAAIAQCFGALLFTVWSCIREYYEDDQHVAWQFLVLETVMTVVLAVVGWQLLRRTQTTQTFLKFCELTIFGIPCVFLTITHYLELTHIASNYGLISQMPVGGWLILIFSYTLFVPRSWRFLFWLSVSFATLPILATIAAMVWQSDVRKAIWFDPSSFIEMILLLIATIGVSVASGRMLSYLRTKADTAKELGRYKLNNKIGSGGMGDVYRAEHRLMKRPCAIKVIRPDKAGDPRAIARFEREVQMTAKLTHWNNISIFDYGRTADGKFYYVMEFLSGLTLQELVKRKGPLPPGRAVYLLKQACQALIEAHSIGLIHRDIKPANLMVTELGGNFDVIKLLDFGLAKPISAAVNSPTDATSEDPGITVAGSLTGSPLYMSPEQALGEGGSDLRSDLYSLGGVAFFMLTGRPPFESASTLKVLLAHMHEQPVAPSTVRRVPPAFSPELDQVILKCLAKAPGDRYQSAREMLEALENLPESKEWTSHTAEHWWNRNCTHQSDCCPHSEVTAIELEGNHGR